MPCPFCNQKIIKQQYFHKTSYAYAILNNKPIIPGHCLVIPKKHIASIEELSQNEIKQLFSFVREITTKLKQFYNCSGYNIAINYNPDAGQTIPHLHIHILPRKKGDMQPDPRNLYYRTEKKREQLTTHLMKKQVKHLKAVFQQKE